MRHEHGSPARTRAETQDEVRWDRPGDGPLTPQVLDALAHVVAEALDDGDDCRAWALTRALEQAAGADDHATQPPGPVIGRRFAAAHRHLLARAGPG